MEKQFRPSPVKITGRYSAVCTLIALSLLISATTTTASGGRGMKEQELKNMTAALRSNGYNLFCNAIATSDLHYQIISGDSSFTFFSPRDSNLFSLDMASDASVYIQTLRFHVVPLRLTIADLLNLSSVGSYLETLLPHYSLLIGKPPAPLDDDVTIDGVRISYPDLYLGSKIAVHGLDGILAARFKYSDNFSGEIGFESPPVGSEQFLSPHSLHFPPNLVPPSRSSPEIIGNSRFKKRRKRHENRNSHGVHGHRQDHQDDDEVNYYQIRHSKFSKLNRQFTGDF